MASDPAVDMTRDNITVSKQACLEIGNHQSILLVLVGNSFWETLTDQNRARVMARSASNQLASRINNHSSSQTSMETVFVEQWANGCSTECLHVSLLISRGFTGESPVSASVFSPIHRSYPLRAKQLLRLVWTATWHDKLLGKIMPYNRIKSNSSDCIQVFQPDSWALYLQSFVIEMMAKRTCLQLSWRFFYLSVRFFSIE